MGMNPYDDDPMIDFVYEQAYLNEDLALDSKRAPELVELGHNPLIDLLERDYIPADSAKPESIPAHEYCKNCGMHGCMFEPAECDCDHPTELVR